MTALIPWKPDDPIQLGDNPQPIEIVQHAVQLTPRDQQAIVLALNGGAYEMAATFVWTKALTALRKQLGELGMEFVGEMLGRVELDESSNPVKDIREDEAIQLAEELGMISTTEAIRLGNAQRLLVHFSDHSAAPAENMQLAEAIMILRSCVVNFLAAPAAKAPESFLKLRRKLQTESLSEGALELESLGQSPYFFIRTTLTLVLTQLKTANGAVLERAAGNIRVLLPVMWPKLREKDRWQIGETYALVHAANRKLAAVGLRAALTTVKGFDFVPETLRSDSFRAAAHAVMTAHLGFDNFYAESKPMRTLARLGSAIPGPALADCVSAAICVYLGNPWGHSFAAEASAEEFFRLLRREQWDQYVNRHLPTDRHVIEKLAYEDKPLTRWQHLIARPEFDGIAGTSMAARLLSPETNRRTTIKSTAQRLREQLMQNS